MMAWLFALCTGVAGVAQASLLARDAEHRGHPAALLLRLGVVSVVLFLTARAGHLVAGVAGWALGFVTAAAAVYRRLG